MVQALTAFGNLSSEPPEKGASFAVFHAHWGNQVSGGNVMTSQKTVSVFLLSLELLLALLVAGVAVPSFVYSGRVANSVSSLHSARSLDVIGVTLIFNFWNIGSAFMGALVGAVMALMLTSRGSSAKGLGQLLNVLYPRKFMRPSHPA